MLAVDAGEILGIFGHDLQKIIRRPCHQVTLQQVRHPGHFALKGVKKQDQRPVTFSFCESSYLAGPQLPVRLGSCCVDTTTASTVPT